MKQSPSASADKTATKPQIGKPFEIGNRANPFGRPKGSRNKLGEQFIQALQTDFEANGKTAIETVRQERPHEYLKVVASLLPKQIEVKEGAFDGVDDETLAALVAAARSALGIVEGGGTGAAN